MEGKLTVSGKSSHSIILEYLSLSQSSSFTKALLSFIESYSKGFTRTIVLIFLFSAPILTTGFALLLWDINTFSRHVLFALVWLAASPFLLRTAVLIFAGYFEELKYAMSSEEWFTYRKHMVNNFLGNKHLFLSIPISLFFFTVTVWYGLFIHMHWLQLIWTVMNLSILGFVAGVGFWGIFCLIATIDTLQTIPLKLDFSHPDGFGGLRCAGNVLVSGIALFYTGSLLFPFAFEIFRVSNILSGLKIITYLIVGFFMFVGLTGFFLGIMKLHKIGFKYKVKVDAETGDQLNALIQDNILNPNTKDLGSVLKPLIYYQTYQQRVGEMKEYPYDGRTILELCASVMIPIAVFLLDKWLK